MTRLSFNAVNSVLLGDCIGLMRGLDAESVDFILTDPPYLVNYRDRSGRRVAGDDDRWLQPAFAEMYRVLKDESFCVSFYGWNKIDLFMAAWRGAGLRIVGHRNFGTAKGQPRLQQIGICRHMIGNPSWRFTRLRLSTPPTAHGSRLSRDSRKSSGST